MSTPAASSAPTITVTRTDFSKDISTLLALPTQTSAQLSSILKTKIPTPASAQPTSSSLLSTFSPARGDIDAGVALSAAYTRDMRALQRQGLEERLEQAGEGIEGVRERAEGVQAALGGVKL